MATSMANVELQATSDLQDENNVGKTFRMLLEHDGQLVIKHVTMMVDENSGYLFQMADDGDSAVRGLFDLNNEKGVVRTNGVDIARYRIVKSSRPYMKTCEIIEDDTDLGKQKELGFYYVSM